MKTSGAAARGQCALRLGAERQEFIQRILDLSALDERYGENVSVYIFVRNYEA